VKELRPNHRTILYCNRNFWLNHDSTSYAGDGLWIAQYNGDPGSPDIRADWVIHQYTNDPIDTNVAAFSSRARMAAWAAGDGESGGGGEGGSEDEIPRRALYDVAGHSRAIRPGRWSTVSFNRRHHDGGWVDEELHPSFLYGPCYYMASVAVRVAGLARGQEFQMRLANYRRGAEGFERTVSMPKHAPVHDGGDGRFVYTWTGYVPGADRGRVRAEVFHNGDETLTLEWARAEALYWPLD
jgi:Glycosyl hydrolases family 25